MVFERGLGGEFSLENLKNCSGFFVVIEISNDRYAAPKSMYCGFLVNLVWVVQYNWSPTQAKGRSLENSLE
jgi:hypothetical protein